MRERPIKKEKIELVETIKENIKEAKSIFFVDFRGLTVPEDTELRKRFRKNNVKYFVCKNTLIKRAVDDLHVEELYPILEGPTAFAVSKEDEIIPGKIIDDFAKELSEEKDVLKFKAGIIDNAFMNADDLYRIISLPSKDMLIAQLLTGLTSPISGLVFILNSILQKLVIAINEIKTKREKA